MTNTKSTWWFDADDFDFPESYQLMMPDGRRLRDAVIWPHFAQEQLGMEVDELWRDIRGLPQLDATDEIKLHRDGRDPVWIPGTHPALRMRGHALRRAKVWLQRRADFDDGVLRRYVYTGWQWRILSATRAVEAMPVSFQELVDRLDEGYARKSGGARLNHWILTRYANGHDNIGWHSDKDRDFDEESFFIVIKLGAARPFALRKADDHRVVFYDELPAGSAVLVRCRARDGRDANRLLQHAVPVVDHADDSGSLVARVIRTTTTFDGLGRNLRRTENARRKRQSRRDPRIER